jgi:GNAT superfamily N-acetyltransferase
MAWRMTSDVAGFLDAAGPYLRRERARNTVILTVTEQLRLSPAGHSSPAASSADQRHRPLFGWWTGPDGGAFMHTPPFPLLLTSGPDAAAELAAALAGRPLSGINAEPEAARRFASPWRAGAGGKVEVHQRQRLYRLGELTWPDPAPGGGSRVAAGADAALVTEWFDAFGREAGELGGGQDAGAVVRDRLGYGGVTLWETGGAPVSLAAVSRLVAGMVRVGPVYTPPPLRGHGYASAVTAAVSGAARASGAAEVLLFTDLANPVSNSIYQRIGYRPVEDRVLLSFSPASLLSAYLAFPGWSGIL